MLSYETAAKLKEAGFPHPEEQKGVVQWVLKDTHGKAYYKNSTTGEVYTIILFPGMCYTPEHVYVPSLSELIEACGNDFKELIKHDPYTTATVGLRLAHGDFSASMYDRDPSTFKNTMFGGKTPEDAVANLYLAINPKT